MKKFYIKYKQKSFTYEIFVSAKNQAEALQWFANNAPMKARIIEIREEI